MASPAIIAAERNEPPPPPLDPSPSSSPDIVDRSDSFNSSPNHFSDSENQSPDVLKSEEYRQLFRLPPEEVLLEDFNCALQENILIQGHMYLFVNFICFYSNIFGFETKRIIPLPEVTTVRRAKTAGLFPNAIEILAGNRKYFFASFLSRDEAFKIINDGWLRHSNGARAISEQKESISESSSQENGFVAVENVKSSNILDNESPSTNPSKDAGIPSIVGDDLVTMLDSEKQCSVKQVAEPESSNSTPSVSWKWNEEDINAPTTDEAYTCVADSVFPIKVEDFFRYFFSDDAVNFLESFHTRCGDKDFKCASWRPQEKFGYARELSFQHPIKLYLGAKFGGCHEVQKFRVYKNRFKAEAMKVFNINRTSLSLALYSGVSNSKMIKKTVSNVCTFKIPNKYFCNEAVKGSGSTIGEFLNEHEKKLTNSKIIPQYDIAIVGGGMVGMALSCFLASNPMTKQLSVAIIDSNPALGSSLHIKKEDPPDPRVSTVTPASISFLQDADAWKYVEQNRHSYFNIMQVWDYTGFGYARYHARDVNKDFLGCVAENKVLHNALYSCAKGSDFKTTIYPLRLSSMTLNMSSMSMVGENTTSEEPPSTQGHGAKLQLSDGSSIYAKLVVAADGGKSHVRELLGIKTTGWNYSQNAIICTVEHTSENGCAWQRFLPTGPIALLPMGDKFSNIVWTMSPTESNNRKSITEEEFLEDVNHALDYGYGPYPTSSLSGTRDVFSLFKIDATKSTNEFFEIPPKVTRLASERMVFPLSLRHANSYASKRVVLIGDAAHTVHPLAGQGVNMGFRDAFSLSRIIAEGLALGTDIGEVNLLKKYEAERKPGNIMMMAILDGFQKAYSVDFGPFNLLRAAAFHGANYISPLKRSIISYASGDHKLPIFL